MAKRTRLSKEEERERREYARLAREERLDERYSSQSKTRRREVAKARTRKARDLGPAPVTDEKAAGRIVDLDRDRYRKERARRYQAERANRPGGPADTSTQYAGPTSTRLESQPISTMTSGGPTGSTLSREGAIKALERDVWRAYVDAGYKRTTQVDDGLQKLQDLRSAEGQSLRELRIAQGLQPRKDPDLLRDEALNFIIGPYLASRLPGGNPTKQDFDPLWDTLDVAGVIPLGRLGRGAGLIGDAIGATRAIDSALGVRNGVRALKYGDAVVETPAAKSLIGRAAETAAEKARPVTSILPGVMSPEQKFGKEVSRLMTTSAQVRGAAATRLGQLSKRLPADEKAAIRFLVEHGNGDADELTRRVAFHASRAAEAANPEARTLSAFVADAFQGASKYVEHTPDGWRLKADAPEKLRRIMALYDSAGATREDILKNLDVMDEADLAKRVQAPAAKAGSEGAGVRYAPYRRGNPITANANPKTWAAATRNFNAGRRSRITFNVRDPGLKQFTGALMDSGYFDINPGPALADNVTSAIRMAHAKQLRDIAERVGSPLPRSADDIAVVVDPDEAGKRVPEALRRVWDRMDAVAENGKLDLSSMDEIEPATLTRTLRELFPDTLGDRAIKDIAEELVFSDTPIPGIVWINPGFADKAGILGKMTSRLAKRNLQTWRRYAQAGRKGEAAQALLAGGVDAINDIQKMAALYINPAYGPVQLVGNAAMNLMQQGIFMPANLTKAFRIANNLGDEATGIVDNLIGEGFYQASTKFEAASPMRVLGKFYSVAIDLGPRRAAFIHEARRAGYKSSAELKALLLAAKTDEKALSTVNQIKQRALAAIVDFDRLSPFEKNVVTRLVWFYPWLKGATHYTKRFPLDHPYQAAALAYIENKRRETKPEGPWYTDYLAKLPVGEDLVMSVAQLHPAFTPMQIADSVAGWATGEQNAPQIVDQFTPFAGAAIRGLAGGTSPTTGAPIRPGLDTLKGELLDPLVNPTARRRIENVFRSDEERAKDNQATLYQTNRLQDALAIPFGTLIPRGYNEKEGIERRRQLEGGKKTSEEKAQTTIEALAEKTGKDVPGWAQEILTKRRQVNDRAELVRARMEEDKGDDLDPHESDVARVEALADVAYGEDDPRVEKMVKQASANPRTAKRLIGNLERVLGYPRVERYGRNLSR